MYTKKVTILRSKSYFTINYIHTHIFCYIKFISLFTNKFFVVKLFSFTSQQVQILEACAERERINAAQTARRYLSPRSSSSGRATYSAGSITLGIGLISVPSSCSIRCSAKRSSYVIKFIAIPRCPKRPERPMR